MTEISKINEILRAIVDAQNRDDWNEIKNLVPSQFHKDPVKYKSISGLFTPEDIAQLPSTIEQKDLTRPIEKLLYAALWKNGDLLKITHIINGIKGVETAESSAMTFYYFGKFLANPAKSPIIDQHVIRAYKAIISKRPLDESLLHEISQSGLLNSKKDTAIVNEYIKWATEKATTIKSGDSDIVMSLELIDDVMFAFGRMLKNSSKS